MQHMEFDVFGSAEEFAARFAAALRERIVALPTEDRQRVARAEPGSTRMTLPDTEGFVTVTIGYADPVVLGDLNMLSLAPGVSTN